MASHEDPDISLESLALEPLDEQPDEAGSKGKAKFQIDTRGGADRRKTLRDRRDAIRFQDDRRSGKDRRAGGNGWVPGVDI